MAHEQHSDEVDAAIQMTHSGQTLQVCTFGGELVDRYFFTDQDGSALRWRAADDDKQYKCIIAFAAVNRVQSGSATVPFQKLKDKDPFSVPATHAARCFSVLHKGESLDLIAPTDEEAAKWVHALSALRASAASGGAATETATLHAEWLRFDKDGSGTLTIDELMQFFEAVNLDISRKTVKELLSINNSDVEISFDQFVVLNSSLGDLKEFDRLFEKYAVSSAAAIDTNTAAPLIRQPSKKLMAMLGGDVCGISIPSFIQFLQQEQGQTCNEEQALAMLTQANIRDFKPSPTVVLTRSQFFAYLSSPSANAWMQPECALLSQDMTQPMSHYYISSSHNTYLEGDQLKSNSSVNTYINAFAQGCRCVELDCWDGPDGDPIIYHGHTLTSKILFRDVIQAVKEHGFVTSLYPIILSLENHCSTEFQKKMASILHEVLGDMLITPLDLETVDVMPSPHSLLHKVLCKDKSQKKSPNGVDDEDSLPEPMLPTSTGMVPESKLNRPVSMSQTTDLPAIITLTSVCFQGLPTSEADLSSFAPLNMVSFSEGQMTKLILKGGASVAQMHTRVLSRIYPSGIRIDSSNYDPIPSWNAGAQVVALNLQTNDEHTILNRGKFMRNGRCGYVLKPTMLLPEAGGSVSQVVNGNDAKTLTKRGGKSLKFRVISARNLPKPDQSEKGEVVDPYVSCFIRGAPCDQRQWKSSYVDNNGFHPVFNALDSTPCAFDNLCAWELGHLVMMVYDHNTFTSEKLLCANAIELSALRRGYRFVPLCNAQGDVIPGCGLFCHFDF